MPQITVRITKGSTEVFSNATQIPSNTLPDLLSSLKQAKVETNSALTELVEKSKGNQTRKTDNTYDDEESDSSSGDDKSRKKQKT